MVHSTSSEARWQGLRALDPEAVENLYRFGRGKPSLLERLARIFLDAVPAQLAELHSALAEGDGGKLARVAHALKGGWQMAGALRFAELSAELERCAKAGDVERWGGDLEALEDEYVRVAADFRDILAAIASAPPADRGDA